MNWTRKLNKSVTLADGRRLATLDDVAELVLALPDAHLHKACWEEAIDLLIDAAVEEAPRGALARAEAQLAFALQIDGLARGFRRSR